MNEHDVLERALQRMGNSPIELNDVYRERERRTKSRSRYRIGLIDVEHLHLAYALSIVVVGLQYHVVPQLPLDAYRILQGVRNLEAVREDRTRNGTRAFERRRKRAVS